MWRHHAAEAQTADPLHVVAAGRGSGFHSCGSVTRPWPRSLLISYDRPVAEVDQGLQSAGAGEGNATPEGCHGSNYRTVCTRT